MPPARKDQAMISLVMTILGPDRPGVVESLARRVSDHGANWLESRMAHLAGQFAGIVHVEVDASEADKLVESLRQLHGQDLTVIVRKEGEPLVAPTFAPLQLDLVGNDRPGIVHEVTRVLADRQVNVEEFQTECSSAPMSGERLFRATARLRLPAGLTVEQLQQALEEIAHDLMVDIRLHPA
jgi:glycine cleavage system regulatory protein